MCLEGLQDKFDRKETCLGISARWNTIITILTLILAIKTTSALIKELNITIVIITTTKKTTTVISNTSKRSTEIETMIDTCLGKEATIRPILTAMISKPIKGESKDLGQEVKVMKAMSNSIEMVSYKKITNSQSTTNKTMIDNIIDMATTVGNLWILLLGKILKKSLW